MATSRYIEDIMMKILLAEYIILSKVNEIKSYYIEIYVSGKYVLIEFAIPNLRLIYFHSSESLKSTSLVCVVNSQRLFLSITACIKAFEFS